MQCVHPLTIRNQNSKTHGLLPGEFSFIVVPCGKCIACRVNRTREWQTRLLMESFYYDDLCFATFTYDNEHIPDGESLCKSDMQGYFKRLRKELSESDRHIRYFCSGEYGDKFGRPHYHAILFGLNGISDRDVISRHWPSGNVYLGSATPKSMRYTAKYIQKKLGGKLADEEYALKHIDPPFQICSQGIGDRFLHDYEERLKKDGFFQFAGVRYPVPRKFFQNFYNRTGRLERNELNYERNKDRPIVPYEVLERRLVTRMNQFARPEYQIHYDADWYLKE